MVRSLDCYWNHFVPNMQLMYRKLADLGVVLADDEAAYMGAEEGSNA